MRERAERMWWTLRRDGICQILDRKLRAIEQWWKMDNWLVGRLVETFGNRVRFPGISVSVDCPAITTRQKSTLFYNWYEREETLLVQQHLQPDLPVVELGAGIGVVSCMVNRRLSEPALHLVIEANPELIPTLETNRDINSCQFDIRNLALGYGSMSADLKIPDSFVFSSVHLEQGRRVSVPTTTLGALIRDVGFGSVTLIADIEGSEVSLIENEPQVIKDHVRMIMMEFHPKIIGEERAQDLRRRIESLGFDTVAQMGNTSVFR